MSIFTFFFNINLVANQTYVGLLRSSTLPIEPKTTPHTFPQQTCGLHCTKALEFDHPQLFVTNDMPVWLKIFLIVHKLCFGLKPHIITIFQSLVYANDSAILFTKV